jgi:hypothetical protein
MRHRYQSYIGYKKLIPLELRTEWWLPTLKRKLGRKWLGVCVCYYTVRVTTEDRSMFSVYFKNPEERIWNVC